MGNNAPRWEWRTFARQIDIDIDLPSFERIRHAETSEIYLVSGIEPANPKIRDGTIDIKTLERVDGRGLEQWKPSMKAAFPLSGDQVAAVFHALETASPDLDEDDYGLERFLALFGAQRSAKAVHVDKVRDQYDVDGCTVEMAHVTVDGDSYQTVAAEHEDPRMVVDTVGRLGIGARENLNYVKFINRIKGLT